ncbi:MAG: shikimate dehydrogenase [Flavobacteriales bacterium]|nr:shikimate dehydrogenase [Flavobacteriales bacterium]
MKRFGIIGRPLDHSASPQLFQDRFAKAGLKDHRYDRFELKDIAELSELLKTPGLRGLNVTHPFKQQVLEHLEELDATARAVGAVNTITLSEERSIGSNTDVIGFAECLKEIMPELFGPEPGVRALVLGSGGASHAVSHVLRELQVPFNVVSRDRDRGDLSWAMVDRTVVKYSRLIVNCTPVGMGELKGKALPLPFDAITKAHILIDLIYDPAETPFMKEGKAQGAKVCNGKAMLLAQAEASWRLWQELP